MRLPTAPAKETDKRSFNGVGGDPKATVQAEAIPPDELAAGLETAIRAYMDMDVYEDVLEREDVEREQLVAAVLKLRV